MNAQTNTLNNLVRRMMAVAPAAQRTRAVINLDNISGYDEMQGYPPYPNGPRGYGPPTVGMSWGDLGHAANLALNPVAQYHALQNAWRGGGHPAAAPRQWGPPPAPQLPPGAVQAGMHGPATLLAYMGLGVLSWVSTDTVTEKQISAEPQAAFRGRRMIVDVAKSAGATGILTTVSQPLTVSGMPQTPAPSQPAPTAMFSADATYSMLDLQIATSGTQINMAISVSAIPASGETVVVSAGLYGEWMR